MRLALFLLAVTAWGQFSITISVQNGAIPAAYLGKPLPAGLYVALTNTCNVGDAPSTVYVDRIAQAVATVAPVQDGAAAKFAAQQVKAGNGKVIALKTLEALLEFAPGAVFGSAGSIIGKTLAAAGGATVVAEKVKDARVAASTLEIPSNWWTPNPTLMASLNPGACYPMLLALGGMPSANQVGIGATPIKVAVSAPVTHPQVDDGPDSRTLQIAAWVREKSARIGAGQ